MYTLVLCLTLAAPAPKESPKKEPPTIVGMWLAESAIVAGRADLGPARMTMNLTKDGKCLSKTGKDDVEEVMGYTTDPSKSPGHFDLMNRGKKHTLQGIYKIEGETLTICLSPMGDRPVEFASSAQTPTILITLKRAKKE